MRTLQRLILVLFVASIFTNTAKAKCPTGSVTVRGRVENSPSAATAAEVNVVVETPKGTVSRSSGLASNEEFSVEVPFSTCSSSFLGGDRCNTVPKFVEVKIILASKVYVQKRFDFKDNFEAVSNYQYRLKQEVYLDVLKEGTTAHVPSRMSDSGKKPPEHLILGVA
jgi:hypothetical protein